MLKSLQTFPVVGLIGSRYVGKTCLCRQLAIEMSQAGKGVLMPDLERPSELAKLADQLVILDGLQQLRPDLFCVTWPLVDAQRRPERFLVLGSAAPALIRQSSETLAGRIEFLELAPLSILEIGSESTLEMTTKLWNRGGFPDSYLAKSDSQSMRWREAFIRTYLERDIAQLGIRVPAATLRRFWLLLAHYHGQLWTASTIAGLLGVPAPSLQHYLNILEGTFMVRVLQPYSAHLGKRLVKSPKVDLRDNSLLDVLLNLPGHHALMGHPVLGASWEGWVIEQILIQAPIGSWPSFFRTASGNEIDLLIDLPGGQLRAIEIKHSKALKVGKGFIEALDALAIESGFAVAPVDAAYPMSARAKVLPLSQFKEIWCQ